MATTHPRSAPRSSPKRSSPTSIASTPGGDALIVRRLFAASLAIAAVGFALTAVGSVWARSQMLDSANFASTARDALDAEPVQELLVRKITDPVIGRLPPEAAQRRGEIERQVAGIVATPEFGAIFETSVEEVHRALVEDEREDVVIDLSPAAGLVRDAVSEVDPRLATAVDEGDLAAVPIGDDEDFPDLSTADDLAGVAVDISMGGAALSSALALLASTSRARLLTRMGLALLAAAVAWLLVLLALPDLVGDRVGDQQVGDAVAAVLDAVLGSLRIVLGGLAAVAGTGAAVSAFWPRRAIAVP